MVQRRRQHYDLGIRQLLSGEIFEGVQGAIEVRGVGVKDSDYLGVIFKDWNPYRLQDHSRRP